MANEVILTNTTAAYALNDIDNLYIGAGAGIVYSGNGAAALYNLALTDTLLDIVIDGRVVSVGGYGIYLVSALPSDSGSDDIRIGLGGLVQSVQGTAINLGRSGETVINAGQISAASSGIFCTGDGLTVNNSGSIISEYVGVQTLGTDNVVANSGTISGNFGLYLGGDSSLVNTGLIVGGLGPYTDAYAIYLAGYDNTAVQNGGTIRSGSSVGLRLGGNINAVATLGNTGTIGGVDAGVLSTAGATVRLILANSGLIEGADDGLRMTGAVAQISNAAGGIIQGASDDGIETAGRLRLVNLGQVLAAGDGDAIALGAGSGQSHIINRGTISSVSGDAVNASGLLAGSGVHLDNFGIIIGNYVGAVTGDYLTNRGTMDSIFSGEGDDFIRNYSVIADYVFLGAGEDDFDGRRGEVGRYVDGGFGNDSIRGGAADNDLRGGTGNDSLLGGNGDDLLYGSLDDDLLTGGTGNDTLDGADNQDTLTGGGGADVFVFTSAADAGLGDTRDRITDFGNGNDKIDLSDFMAGASFIGAAAFSGTGPEVRYVAGSGMIFGDATGDGLADWQVQLANKPALTAGDFIF